MAQVDSLPVAKTDIQKLPTTLELRVNGERRHSQQHNAGMHSHECAQVTVKLNSADSIAWVVGHCLR